MSLYRKKLKDIRYVAIIKDPHQYLFFYTPGDEAELFSTVMNYAKSKDFDLNWNDVVLFLGKMRQMIKQDIKAAINENT